MLGFNVWVSLFICVFMYLYFNSSVGISFSDLRYRLDKMKYKKTENNTWTSLVRTCKNENIQLADIIIHTKYPIDSERLFGFSLIQSQSNVSCGLILHDYDCIEMTLDETRSSMFREDEWEYLLPQLESNGLVGVPLNVFWRESSLPPNIIGVLTKNRAVYFFSNFYVRLVYKVENDEVPSKLFDLFIDDDACLKGVCVRAYKRNPPK